MTTRAPTAYGDLAERAWRWVLDQVRWDDDGPWIPVCVDPATGAPVEEHPPGSDEGSHSGAPGLAHVLSEIRLARTWTPEEVALAEGLGQRVVRAVGTTASVDYFDGLSSHVGVLVALDAPGSTGELDRVLSRALDLAGPDGWGSVGDGGPSVRPGAPYNDVTMGNASLVLAGLWAARHGAARGREVAGRAADVVLSEAQTATGGLAWPFVSPRFVVPGGRPPPEMPNWSHGTAGIGAALALAGAELGRPDLVEAALRGAGHVVALADRDHGGLRVPRALPADQERHGDLYTYGWCHGTTGTSRLFLALDHVGAGPVAGRPALEWHDRAIHSALTSGLPTRRHPGFWDNDGRCCGSAGAGDIVLDAWQRTGREDWLGFATRVADAVVDRAVRDGPLAYWRFVEHRATDPLLPPGVGWMQGAAGIAAFLLRVDRVLRDGRDAPAVARMDSWWGGPGA